MSKRNYKITPSSDFFKVEVADDYGFNTTVYERSVIDAWKFIYNWWGNANERKETNDKLSKAILECKEIDSKNPNLRDIL